jgi:sugar phosphate isomerase/epimerase
MVPEWDLSTAVGKLAAYGYDGIEWRVTNTEEKFQDAPVSYWGRNRCTVELDTILDRAEEVREITQSAGLEIPALAGYHLVEDLDATRKMLEAARIMGARLVRVIPGLYDKGAPYERQFERARSFFEKTEALAVEAGVRVCLETHPGHLTPSASAARRLLDGLNPKGVGVILDPGNMVSEGYEQIGMGIEILGAFLAHVHVKNAVWKNSDKAGERFWVSETVPIDEGAMDWAVILDELRAAGYEGYLSFEDFSASRSSEDKVRFNIKYIRSVLRP